jgi:hypothetical protein
MTGAVRLEILSSLASVRDDVERHVAKLDRYRALKAIERTIAEFPGLDDLNRALSDLRDGLQQKLNETREVRALRAIEKITPELSEVLSFLAERTEKPSAEEVEHGRDRVAGSSAPSFGPADDDISQTNKVTVVIATSSETVEHSDMVSARQVPQQEFAREESTRRLSADNADPGDTSAPANDSGSSADTGNPASPAFSYGIAQFLNPEESSERASGQMRHDDELESPHRVAPSQEGRAA